MKHLLGEVKTALATAAPVALFNYLSDTLDKNIERLKKLGEEADKLSVSTDFLQALKLRAENAYMPVDKVKDALTSLSEALGKLKNDEGDLKTKLGETNKDLLEQLRHVTTGEQGMRIMADAIAKVKSPTEQADLAVKAFGKSNQEMWRILNDGQAAIDQTVASMRRYGVLVEESAIRTAQDARRDLAKLAEVLNNDVAESLLKIAPIIAAFSKGIKEASAAVGDFYQIFKDNDGASMNALNQRMAKLVDDYKSFQTDLDKIREGKRRPTDHNWVEEYFGLSFSDNAKEEERITNRMNELRDRINDLQRAKESLQVNNKPTPTIKPSAATDTSSGDDDDKKLARGAAMMASLNKTYLTETKQANALIWADALELERKFEQAKKDGLVTEQQYNDARVKINEITVQRLNALMDEQHKHFKEISKTIEQDLGSAFDKWVSGGKVSTRELFQQIMQDIIKMEFRLQVLQPLFGGGTSKGLARTPSTMTA
jgi:hypothetical protein